MIGGCVVFLFKAPCIAILRFANGLGRLRGTRVPRPSALQNGSVTYERRSRAAATRSARRPFLEGRLSFSLRAERPSACLVKQNGCGSKHGAPGVGRALRATQRLRARPRPFESDISRMAERVTSLNDGTFDGGPSASRLLMSSARVLQWYPALLNSRPPSYAVNRANSGAGPQRTIANVGRRRLDARWLRGADG